MRRPSLERACLALVCVATLAGCVHIFRTGPDARPLTPPASVQSPVKVHLVDGRIVVFPYGLSTSGDTLVGAGTRYSLTLAMETNVDRIPLDSVLGLEAVETGVDVGSTVAVSALITGGLAAVGAAAAVAVFGSCPTVYTATEGGPALEGELFSHSIAPLLEARDVDVLGVRAESGVVRLDVRNEALETHFINHLELLEVVHAPDEKILPDEVGLPVAVSRWLDIDAALDRAGRDVRADLSARDERAFATVPARVAAATVDDLTDHIVLELAAPDEDSVAVVLRLRNSLLNTVLLYDFMLGQAGLQAVDWLGGTMQRIGSAIELGAWYRARMGFHAEVWEAGAYRPVARVPDSGPIAWKETVFTVPVPSGEDRLRIRLSFLADQWRIDRVRVAASVRRPEVRVVPVARIEARDGTDMEDARAAVSAPDDRFLETRPGGVFDAVFEVGPEPEARTFLVAAQGYYTEWIRPDWVRSAEVPKFFVPSDESLVEVLARWQEVRPRMEEDFFRLRIPTR